MSEMIRLVEVALAGGVGYILKSAWDLFARRSDAKTPQANAVFQLTHTGQQVDILARVNSELEDDMNRFRAILTETETRARASEAAWQVREAAWFEERRKLQEQLDAMQVQARRLLDELETLKQRWRSMERGSTGQ